MREMKDTSTTWLRKIPSDWRLSRIGSLYSVRNEKVSDKDFEPLSVTMKGIVPQLATAAKTDEGDNRKLVRKGDFAINSRSDRRGSCGISAYDGSVSLINTVLIPRSSMHPGYYNWLFHTAEFADEFYRNGHGIVDDLWTTRWQEMKAILVPVPSNDEQSRIAAYLDRRCAIIDSLIANQLQQIEKLKLYKQAVITEAVTHGLDPTVPMKDSGVEWIGNVPANWAVPKVNFVAVVRSGGTPDRNHEEYWNGTIPWIKTGELQNDELYDSEEYITDEGLRHSSAILFPKNTILVAMYGQGKTRGMTALLKCPATTNQACAAIQLYDNRMNVEYLWLCLMGAYDALRKEAVGSGQPNLSQGLLRDFRVTMPPLNEQKHIVEIVTQKMKLIDVLMSTKQQKIDKLVQYKKSLIYEIVTGKRKVMA